ncbi:MAG: hypothetical protein QOF18_1993 [Frankiaceae bacterium]|jgi:nitrogen-specific signal transduction histidine kinase|nr:hypothetical protein [Frankiaceae bacterium]
MQQVVVLRVTTEDVDVLCRCVEQALSHHDDDELSRLVGGNKDRLRSLLGQLATRRLNVRHAKRAG